jgi:hypothetical protein
VKRARNDGRQRLREWHCDRIAPAAKSSRAFLRGPLKEHLREPRYENLYRKPRTLPMFDRTEEQRRNRDAKACDKLLFLLHRELHCGADP